MDEVIMLLGEKTKEILRCVHEKNITAQMSYSYDQRWHRRSVCISKVDANAFDINIIEKAGHSDLLPEKGQLIGISFQYEHNHSQDRFIFGTEAQKVQGDTISLSLPEEIEVIRNNSFIPCSVPCDLDISVGLWQKKHRTGYDSMPAAQILQGWSGHLREFSADCVCVSVDAWQGFDLKTGDYVGFRFVPFNHESPITANACIKRIILTTQAQENWLELEIIGLEASPEGRMVLRRLCNVVSRFRQMPLPQKGKSYSLSHIEAVDRY